MKWLLIHLTTAVATLAGWHFAQEGHKAVPQVQVQTTHVPALSAAEPSGSRSEPDSLLITSTMEQLFADYKKDGQREEFASRLYAETRDLDSHHFGAAIAAARSTDNTFGHFAAVLLAGLWVERDLPAARQWLLSLETPEWYSSLEVFETWARKDPHSMFDWLETHPSEIKAESLREAAAFIAAKSAGRIAPERGLKIIETLAPEHYKQVALWNIYGSWAKASPLEAAAHVLQEPTESRRTKATEAVLHVWSVNDSVAARSWAQDLPDPVLTANALSYIGGVLASHESIKGATFLVSVPQSDAVRRTLQEVLSQWKQGDLNALLRWAANLSDDALGGWVVQQATSDLLDDQLNDALTALSPEERGNLHTILRRAQDSAAGTKRSFNDQDR